MSSFSSSVRPEAVTSAERFYPAFQLTCWGDESPERAMDVAMARAYGRA